MKEVLNILTEKKNQLIDLTEKTEEIVKKSGIKDGVVLIFSFHTSCAVLVNEDEEGLKKDWFKFLENITSGIDFLHNKLDNNACAHLVSGLIGNEKFFLIENGEIIKGTWQRIFLMEFDGPRERKVLIKVLRD
jgi:secondary thiamine-phosphate synthase enzyme